MRGGRLFVHHLGREVLVGGDLDVLHFAFLQESLLPTQEIFEEVLVDN